MAKYNFKKLDEEGAYNFKADLLAATKRLGYTYISEAIYKLHQRHKSMRKAAKDLGVSSGMIRHHIRRCGFPRNGLGGSNNPIKLTLKLTEQILILHQTLNRIEIQKKLGVTKYCIDQAISPTHNLHKHPYDPNMVCKKNCTHQMNFDGTSGWCQLFNDELKVIDEELVSSKNCLTRCRRRHVTSKNTRRRKDKVHMRVLDRDELSEDVPCS